MHSMVIGEYPTFNEAGAAAKSTALDYRQVVALEQTSAGWKILVDADSEAGRVHLKAWAAQVLDEATLDSNNAVDRSFDEEYEREVMTLVREDMSDEQDAWSLSNDDGWFYTDDD